MADRSIVYRLIADTTQFRSGMQGAATSTQAATAQMDTATKSTGRMQGAMGAMGIGAGVAAAAIGTKVVMSAANFEQAMSSVQAATHETTANMALLEQAALDAGASTAFSATEAAAGIENLAKAGVSTEDIINGGLAGALDLAAAGSLDVASAAEFTATALTQFKLAGEDATHVADLLAAGAGKAQGEVADMANALNYVGVPAANLGVTIEETAGAIALLASNGIIGEQAGTSLRGMLASLTSPSKVAAKEMDKLGISVFDAKGQFVGFEGIAAQLQGRLGGLSDAERSAALGRIFGNEQLQAANVLYREGAGGVQEWTAAVDDSGYAAETAAIQMDNLKGKWEEFTGALETSMIQQGEGTSGPLGMLLDGGTKVLDLFGDLNEATDGWITAMSVGPIGTAAKAWDDVKGLFGQTADEADKATEATEGNATASGLAAGAADQLSGAMAQSALEIEAQAKALEDAQDAARDTAGSFFNLGDSLNDASVSLGDWIGEMEAQARALKNFRVNAEQAAENGLRKGLIAALKEAGPEGARRMEQLANASEGEIGRANRAWKGGQEQIDKYVDATAKVPKEKSTTITVDSAQAMSNLRAIKAYVDGLKSKSITLTTIYNRVNANRAPGATPSTAGPQEYASGGPIYGPGTATSDSIPAYLSNGEYVIKAAAVEKYGTHMFDGLNAMRFADGGEVKKKPRRTLEMYEDPRAVRRLEMQQAKLEKAIDRLGNEIEANSENLSQTNERLGEATAAYDAVVDKMGQAGAGSVAGFNAGLFDRDSNVWGAGAGGGWFHNLSKDIAGLEERGGLQSALAAQGLSGDALAALLAQGSNADLQGIVDSGRAAEFQAMFNTRANHAAVVSQQAGQYAYGHELPAVAAEVIVLQSQMAMLVEQNAQMVAQNARLVALQNTNAERTGIAVAAGVNGGASDGRRQKATKPKGRRR